MAVDPVCGMYVSENSNIYSDKDGVRYYFCSEGCREKFDSPNIEEKLLKYKLIIAWVFSMPILIIDYLFTFSFKNYLLFILVLPVQLYSGFNFYRGAYEAIKNKMGNMDLLITLGTVTAFIFSIAITFDSGIFPVKYTYFDASAFIITLILTGSYIESLTKKKANSSANKLLSLLPSEVHLYDGDNIIDTEIDKIKINDRILIRPGENIPVDGKIFEGASEVDESMITGEGMPILKKVNDDVISGTKNINGELSVTVKNYGANSTVNKIYSMIQMASMGRAKIQKIADIFSSYFVPIVLAVALSSSIFWYFYLKSVNNPLYTVIAILVFVSVVVIACPCAIGLAAPITLLISSNQSSENGILIKNSSSMDRLSKIDTVIFDKTGTLTDNDPEIKNLNLYGDNKYIYSLLYSMEIKSNHPVAKAITGYLKNYKYDIFDIRDFKEIPGYGVTGYYGNDFIEIKKSSNKISLMVNSEEHASMETSYSVRKNVDNAIKRLKNDNINIIIVTGDSEENTEKVADYLGISKYYYDIKPEGKAEIVKNEQKNGKYVMFVGDGINDTIAMETADVGVAMSSGSDIAKESGDIILLNNDLNNIYSMLIIGRYTIGKVRQNIGWAIGYNSALIPVAAGVLVPLFGLSIYYILPIFAALAMGLSSTTVVLNSLRIKDHIKNAIAV